MESKEADKKLKDLMKEAEENKKKLHQKKENLSDTAVMRLKTKIRAKMNTCQQQSTVIKKQTGRNKTVSKEDLNGEEEKGKEEEKKEEKTDA